MRYLIFTNTPAHVHLYRNAVEELQRRGHEVLVLGRDYACTRELLEYYDLPYELYGRQDTTQQSLALALPSQFARITRKARRYDPDLIFGRGAYSAFAGIVSRTPNVLLLDSVPWNLGVELPSRVSDAVITTRAFRGDLGSHHYRFEGVTECAYLHPEVYEPDSTVRRELGVESDEDYVVLRFNAFDALHDIGENGFAPDERRRLVRELSEEATVFVSDEGGTLDLDALPARPYDLHPGRIHDALREAELLVADTGTMVTEAALLGTPALRASDLGDDDLGEFLELEEHGLARNIGEFEEMIEASRAILEDGGAQRRWREKRDEFMREQVNLTRLVVDVAERPEEVERITSRRPPAKVTTR